MDIDRARALLGVDAGATPHTLRAAHRIRIRRAHPDAGGSDRAAAELNAALAVLLDAPIEPRSESPTPRTGDDPTDPDADAVRLVATTVPDASAANDLVLRLAEAGHAVGEVVFVDPHLGLLEIVVGDAPAVGQLAVSVGVAGDDGTPVAFTLEPLGVTPAPPIGDVVDALMAALRR